MAEDLLPNWLANNKEHPSEEPPSELEKVQEELERAKAQLVKLEVIRTRLNGGCYVCCMLFRLKHWHSIRLDVGLASKPDCMTVLAGGEESDS